MRLALRWIFDPFKYRITRNQNVFLNQNYKRKQQKYAQYRAKLFDFFFLGIFSKKLEKNEYDETIKRPISITAWHSASFNFWSPMWYYCCTKNIILAYTVLVCKKSIAEIKRKNKNNTVERSAYRVQSLGDRNRFSINWFSKYQKQNTSAVVELRVTNHGRRFRLDAKRVANP